MVPVVHAFVLELESVRYFYRKVIRPVFHLDILTEIFSWLLIMQWQDCHSVSIETRTPHWSWKSVINKFVTKPNWLGGNPNNNKDDEETEEEEDEERVRGGRASRGYYVFSLCNFAPARLPTRAKKRQRLEKCWGTIYLLCVYLLMVAVGCFPPDFQLRRRAWVSSHL